MTANNSIQRFTDPTKTESQDTQGITQFPTSTSWNQTMGGLIFQGGKVSAGAVTFSVPYKKQLLGVFVSSGALSAETLKGFTASSACYWIAIGV